MSRALDPLERRAAIRTFLSDYEKLANVPDYSEPSIPALLDVSGVLRRQLLDGAAHRANRDLGLSFHFRARKLHDAETVIPPDSVLRAAGIDPAGAREELTYWIGESLDPAVPDNRHHPAEVVTVEVDGWMAHRVGFANGQYLSVRSVIKQVANVQGGIHLSSPKTDMERHLLRTSDVDERAPIGGPVRQIVHVARVTARGLTPLYTQLTSAIP